MIELIEAGNTLKILGIQGELKMDLSDQFVNHVKKIKTIFLFLDGAQVPFFIESIRSEDPFIVKFRDINSPEQAKFLANKKIYVDKNRLPKSVLQKAKIETQTTSLENFLMHDITSGIKIKIISVEDYPSQLMAIVALNNESKMIPLHNDWIESIDQKEKTVYIHLPEGLLDL